MSGLGATEVYDLIHDYAHHVAADAARAFFLVIVIQLQFVCLARLHVHGIDFGMIGNRGEDIEFIAKCDSMGGGGEWRQGEGACDDAIGWVGGNLGHN